MGPEEPMTIHCVVCGATIALPADEAERVRVLRTFEAAHDTRFGGWCGARVIGAIFDILELD
jgi:hypothetical protein